MIVCGWALVTSVQAQTQTDSWTYVGGALHPDTYSALGTPGKYRPATLIPDALAANGATIGVTGQGSSGGLGSSGFPDGYGVYYTFFSAPVTFTLQTANVLAGIDTITVSLSAGGGNPTLLTYNASSLALNYNPTYSNQAASTFSQVSLGLVDTPIGETAMTQYTWTWNVSALGASSGFSTTWTTGYQHSAFGEFQLTQQSVPEPSSVVLAALGMAGLSSLRRRPRQSARVSI